MTGGERRRRLVRRPPPALGIALGTVGLAFFVVPLLGLLERAPWSDFWELLTDETVLEALRLSLICSLSATALSIVFGVPLAWILARSEFPGRRLARALVVLPMVLPPVVGGVALLFALGRRGLVGQHLYEWFDIQLPFSTWGAILAETFVAMPFLVITVEAALRGVDRRYEDAAATLGAGRWTVFRRVTLPLIAPSLIAGTALAWARALGEFGATITFAGNFPGRTQTIPLAVFVALESNPGAAIVMSLILLLVSIVVLVALRDQWLAG
ncbi:MAG: ABC transporter permease [Acidimicrobiia bacterium]